MILDLSMIRDWYIHELAYYPKPGLACDALWRIATRSIYTREIDSNMASLPASTDVRGPYRTLIFEEIELIKP